MEQGGYARLVVSHQNSHFPLMSGWSRRSFVETVGSTLGLSAAFSSFSGSWDPAAPRPNILFLFSDDHSVPDLGTYGNEAVRTPNLDQLAEEGMQFDRAYVPTPQCSPCRASVLTGRVPHDVHASRLHADVPEHETNLVRLLNENGYYTGAYRKVHQATIQNDFHFYGEEGVALSDFFEQRPDDQPFFLWFGSHDPHREYGPGAIDNPHDPAQVQVPEFLPDTEQVRQDLAYYYDEIARFDRECGELLALLEDHGVAENTMVVMTGDNGMPFPRAKGTLYEPGLRVPLLVRWPEVVPPGQVNDALVSLVDLTATWLEGAGIERPPVMQSRSLMPLLTGQSEQVRDFVFAERNWHDNWDPMRCIIGDRYKLIQRYRPEMPYIPSLDILNSPSYEEIQRLEAEEGLPEPLSWYAQPERPQVEFLDLEADPGEWNNLADTSEHRNQINEYQLELGRWMERTHDFLPPPLQAFPGGLDSDLNSRIDPLNGRPREE